MIKLKDILFEATAPDIFIPRRTEDRLERMIKQYIRNGSKGNLDVSNLKLIVLPDMLKDISVAGSFYCGNNKLTSLINAPKSVGRGFDCNSNDLTSLEGAPTYVGGDFYCSLNKLTSLTGAPKTVGGTFRCAYNNLTSLDGAPKTVGEYFICNDNTVKFSVEQVRAVCTVNGRIYV